jgi:hypothetical protein
MILGEDLQPFEQNLRELTLNESARQQIASKQQEDMTNWDCIDGRFYERFEAVVNHFAILPRAGR